MSKELWSTKGYPHKGWYWVGIEDAGDRTEKCEFCGTLIRYVHTIEHDEVSEAYEVGCVCAESLTEDYVNPRTGEKQIKRKKNNRLLRGNNKETLMSLMPLDFSGEVTPLQPGTYNARIVAAEAKTSQNGNPYINWQLETFGSPEVNGRRLFHTTPTSGGWVTKLAELHRAATGEEIDKKAKQYDPEMLVGRELVATVGNRSYTATDGSQKTSLEIKSVAPKKA